ncbi:MAG: hypothetical protein MUF14_05685 [Hyphomonadaceae bacterium]|jgi:hypothetical protein|nr:hypothetical protein [Hyphomonadaceae bacterium]
MKLTATILPPPVGLGLTVVRQSVALELARAPTGAPLPLLLVSGPRGRAGPPATSDGAGDFDPGDLVALLDPNPPLDPDTPAALWDPGNLVALLENHSI